MTSLSAFDTDRQPAPEEEGRGAAPAPPNPLVLLHRGLRGRYSLAVVLGLVMGACFLALAYVFVKPQYESIALVRVRPTQARIIYQTEDNAQMANFDSFVMAQVSFIQSRRVIELALASDKLSKAGWDRERDGTSAVVRGLDVSRPKGSEIIRIAFKHTDPVKAQAAVNSLVEAYNKLKDEEFGLDAGVQERAIESRIKSLESKLAAVRQSEIAEASKFGVADIEALHRSKSDLLALSDQSILQLSQQIKQAEALQPAQGPDSPAPATDELSDAGLAAQSSPFADLLRQRAIVEGMIRDRVKLTAEHRERRVLEEQLARLNSQIAEMRVTLVNQPSPANGVPAISARDQTLPQMKTFLSVLEADRAVLLTEVRSIGQARQQMQSLQEQKEDIKRDLEMATSRQTALEVERNNSTSGRISVMQTGDQPLEPSTDRRVPLMGAGAIGGLGMGVGIVWLMGFLLGGCRFATDVQDPALSAPLLEVLPHLDHADPEWLDLAAHSVHHIRSILNNTRPDGDVPIVILVTSATAGEGKSYIANALAHSFAIADHRTVVVDADLLGHQLSARLGCAEKPGLRDAAHANEEPPVYPVDRCLDIVPVGLRDDFQPEQFNRAYFVRVLESLRSRYDTIIIDSGPILGSLEANLLAPLADRTVMIVGRGQSPRMVQAAIGRIRQLGGTLAGFVFNRAVQTDYLTSSYSASVSRQSVMSGNSRPRPRPLGAPASPLLISMRSSLAGEKRESKS